MFIKPFPVLDAIEPIAVPIPDFNDLISCNIFAVGNGPVTLIDTGFSQPDMFNAIEGRLASKGFTWADIERIIITHGHGDHFGLASRIRDAAGHFVECLIHPEDVWRVSREHFEHDTYRPEEEFMTLAGVPEERNHGIRRRYSVVKSMCEPIDRVSLLRDGERIEGNGFCLEVIHTPGHSAGSVCLYETRHKVLFTGDTVIKHITPNPLVELRKEHLRDHHYRSLGAYMESLEKLSGLDVQFVFPAHGEFSDDLHGLIDSYRSHHRERMELVWEALRKDSRPFYQILDEVFPIVPEDHLLLAISEIVVHLEMLVEEGRAELLETGPPVIYHSI